MRTELATPTAGEQRAADAAAIALRVSARLADQDRPSLTRVINATGVVLHTNLGRAPLAPSAVDAVVRAASGYVNLEYDVAAGARGSRYVHCAALLRELTGAEDALVVNNNAAALVLALNTLASDRAAVISRGELVEIGGSFRVAEIMARSGARLREVGSTNRTHASDYRDAIGADTGVVLKVHRSNFTVHGFTSEVGIPELREVCAAVPLLHDLGSGLLLESALLGLPPELTVRAAVAEGADLVTFSGDKLLGGPQAGIIAGRADLIGRMRANPLCRALRVDKLTLAALEATLMLYREPARAMGEIPALRMLAVDVDALEERAAALQLSLRARGYEVEIVKGESMVGGGAFPEAARAAALVALPAARHSAAALESRLRAGAPPVIARISGGRVLLDLRTVLDDEFGRLAELVADALG